VRHFNNPIRISPYIRITIGTDQQTDQLIASLQTILN
jgi:histidinol-phosphate aminotransferase